MAELTCPPLGTGSVDMSALHEAAKKLEKTGGDLTKAVEAATTRVEAPVEPTAPTAPADPAPAPSGEAA